MRRIFAAGGLALSLASSLALAQEKAPQPQAEPEDETCPRRCVSQTSAIDTVARALAAGLGKVPAGVTVMTAPLVSDEEARRGDDLATLVAAQLAGRLGAEHRAGPLTIDQARAQATAPGIIVVQPRIEQGRLRVVADAYPIASNVWARARAAKHAGPRGHAQALAPIDAEVRGYLAPLGIGDAMVARFEGADLDIEAIACGDLDGDGETDVVTMNRQRILRVRLVEGQVERLHEARWDDLAPIAPVPLREPLGFATITPGAIDVALSDRRGSVRLSPSLELVTAMKGKAVPHGRATACTFFHDLRLAPTLQPCSKGDRPPAIENLRHRADTLASTILVNDQGEARTLVALRKDGTLVLRDGERDSFVARVGAQIAAGDLDQDGQVELVSTIDTLAPKHDAIEVRTLGRTGTVTVKRKIAVPTGVEAVAVCPPDRAAQPAPVLVATAGAIWVVR